MDILIYILIGLALAVLAYIVLFGRTTVEKTVDKNWDNTSPFEYPLPDFAGNYTSPKGAQVVTEVPLPDDDRDLVLRAIDVGIDDYLRSTAQFTNYTEYKSHAQFTVAMLTRTVPSEDTGAMVLKIRIPAAWKGSEYDTGTGYLKAAGLVLGLDDRLMAQPVIFIGYNTTHLDFVAEVVRFEAEHICAYFNDRDLFHQTMNVHQHPIYPLPAATGFASVAGDKQKSEIVCGLG